jgi:EAL domain-containing protein (putative c-di-GMP-specific phosphodiesterase class I)
MSISAPPHAAGHHGLSVESFFQPIYSLAHRRTVGVEALVRPAPEHADKSSDNPETRHKQDLSASVAHIERYLQHFEPPCWLCLNVDGATLAVPEHTNALVDSIKNTGIQPESVVLELLEPTLNLGSVLDDSVGILKSAGFLVAIDNFGMQPANLERIYRLAPDMVKFSSVLINNAVSQPRSRSLLSKLVHLMHEAGALVVEEGVESEDEVRIALESGCDLVQGYFVAPPAAAPETDETITPRIDAKWDELMGREMLKRKVTRRHLELARQAFVQAAIALMQGTPFSNAATPMLDLPDVLRCFLLNQEGRQIGKNLNSRMSTHSSSPKFAPLADTTGAIWSRRAYFQHAIEQPGVLYMSQPYLSMTDTRTCVTLSMAIEIDESLHVLCADLEVQR